LKIIFWIGWPAAVIMRDRRGWVISLVAVGGALPVREMFHNRYAPESIDGLDSRSV